MARTMTDAQVATLALDIPTHPELDQYWLGEGNDNVAIRIYYNDPDPTLADCWRTSLSLLEVLDAVNWSEFIGRSQGERDAFRMIFMGFGTVNPSKPNIRAAFLDIFSGPSGVTTRTALTAAAKRKMTRAERLFATNGSGVFTLVYQGQCQSEDTLAAMGLIPGA